MCQTSASSIIHSPTPLCPQHLPPIHIDMSKTVVSPSNRPAHSNRSIQAWGPHTFVDPCMTHINHLTNFALPQLSLQSQLNPAPNILTCGKPWKQAHILFH